MELEAINDCTCEGYDQVYECRITGGGAIVWRGSIFDCPASGNEIVLFNRSSSVQKSCNNGAIVGQITRTESNTYVSQLTVSISAEMIGKNISCFHDNNGGTNLIGSSLLSLRRGTCL